MSFGESGDVSMQRRHGRPRGDGGTWKTSASQYAVPRDPCAAEQVVEAQAHVLRRKVATPPIADQHPHEPVNVGVALQPFLVEPAQLTVVAVVVAAVAVVIPVGLVLLFVVRVQIVHREAVVARHEVDAVLGLLGLPRVDG